MKGFIKFVLFVVFAMVIWQWLFTPDVHIVYEGTNVHGMSNFWLELLVPFFVAFVVLGAMCLAFGVVIAVIVAFAIAAISILFVGISMFWPILVAIFIFYWLFSDSKQNLA